MTFVNEKKSCDCLIKCKYPPPSTPSIVIPSTSFAYSVLYKKHKPTMLVLFAKKKRAEYRSKNTIRSLMD